MWKVVKKLKLSELPFGSNITINGNEYQFKGFEKRKTNFGRQEHFIFFSEKLKLERNFERFKFATAQIKQLENGEYHW